MDRVRVLFYLGELLVAVALIALLLHFRRRGLFRLRESWRQFAACRGFSFAAGPEWHRVAMTGVYGGIPVRVELRKIGMRVTTFQPFYEAPFAFPWPPGLEIHLRACSVSSGREILTGDPQIDRLVRVFSPDPRAVPWLAANPAVRRALLAFFSGTERTRRTVALRGAEILDVPGGEDHARLETQLRALTGFVRAVNAAVAPRGH